MRSASSRGKLAAAWVAVLAALPAGGCRETPPVIVNRERRGGTDVTFLVAADTHFGASDGIAALNRKQIAAMNALPGARYPAAIGGTVAVPRGVLIAGDLTEDGTESQWRQFVELYGLTGKDALLRYPVYECSGNHDRYTLAGRPVLKGVRERHRSLTYSWDFDDVHIVCLDEYPDRDNCRWLAKDLAAVGRKLPVVIYFHYAILGPYSGPRWWSQREKDRFRETIEGFNVIAIFHGHYHGSQRYQWAGYDVYNVGSPKHAAHSFAVVRVTDTRLTVASFNWDYRAWQWHHVKEINAPAAATAPR